MKFQIANVQNKRIDSYNKSHVMHNKSTPDKEVSIVFGI